MNWFSNDRVQWYTKNSFCFWIHPENIWMFIFRNSNLKNKIFEIIRFLHQHHYSYVGLFLFKSYSLDIHIHTLASILSTGSKIASFFSCSSVLRSFNHRDMGLIPFNLVWTSTWKIKITWNLMNLTLIMNTYYITQPTIMIA